MTAKVKIAVSLPTRLVDAAKRAVRAGRATSVSAYVAEAMEAKKDDEGFRDLLDEMLEDTGGPLTDEERAWADRILGHPADQDT